MSNALQTSTLIEGIRAAVVAAWSMGSVDIGTPRTLRTLPYAVIYWESVQQQFSTMTKVEQTNRFRIMGRWANPGTTTDLIELQKVSRANELIAQLQTGSQFASIGYLPIVVGIEATESDEPDEGAYEVTVTFEVRTECDHH